MTLEEYQAAVFANAARLSKLYDKLHFTSLAFNYSFGTPTSGPNVGEIFLDLWSDEITRISVPCTGNAARVAGKDSWGPLQELESNISTLEHKVREMDEFARLKASALAKLSELERKALGI